MKNLLAISGLTLALMSGAALAQVSIDGSAGLGADVSVGSDSGSVDAGVDAGANASAGSDGGNAGVGADIDGSVTAGADTGESGADANVGADGSVTADVGSDGGTLDADADASATADADVGIDDETTAAIGAEAEVESMLDQMGSDADQFFTDDTRTQIVADAEFQEAFSSLDAEQQASLMETCGQSDAGANTGATTDVSASAAVQFCSAVMRM